MKRRAPGDGTIETRRNDDGTLSYRARVPNPDGEPGEKVSGPWVSDPDMGEEWRKRLLRDVASGKIAPRGRDAETLAEMWADWIENLEALKKPRAGNYAQTWRQTIVHFPIARMAIEDIGQPEIRDFHAKLLRSKVAKGTRPIATGTAKTVIASLSAALTEARTRQIIGANPMHGLDLEWPEEQADEGAIEYFELAEIDALLHCAAVPEDARLVIQFAIGSGLREGEMCFMPLGDLERAARTGQLFVRFGSATRKPKGGKTRTIPLLPMALDAAERWLALLPTFCPENPAGRAFPTARGNRRKPTAMVGERSTNVRGERHDLNRWHDHTAAAGVRRLVWHGLRHTCGAALASGWWGRTWALHEIRDLMGHSSVTTTEKYYGHLAPSALQTAADATRLGVPSREPRAVAEQPLAVVPRSPADRAGPRPTSSRLPSSSWGQSPVIPMAYVVNFGIGTGAGLRYWPRRNPWLEYVPIQVRPDYRSRVAPLAPRSAR